MKTFTVVALLLALSMTSVAANNRLLQEDVVDVVNPQEDPSEHRGGGGRGGRGGRRGDNDGDDDGNQTNVTTAEDGASNVGLNQEEQSAFDLREEEERNDRNGGGKKVVIPAVVGVVATVAVLTVAGFVIRRRRRAANANFNKVTTPRDNDVAASSLPTFTHDTFTDDETTFSSITPSAGPSGISTPAPVVVSQPGGTPALAVYPKLDIPVMESMAEEPKNDQNV